MNVADINSLTEWHIHDFLRSTECSDRLGLTVSSVICVNQCLYLSQLCIMYNSFTSPENLLNLASLVVHHHEVKLNGGMRSDKDIDQESGMTLLNAFNPRRSVLQLSTPISDLSPSGCFPRSLWKITERAICSWPKKKKKKERRGAKGTEGEAGPNGRYDDQGRRGEEIFWCNGLCFYINTTPPHQDFSRSAVFPQNRWNYNNPLFS